MKILFIADQFAKDLTGGAELSTEALIETCPFESKRAYSLDVTKKFIQEHLDWFWIFGNWASLDFMLLNEIEEKISYAVIEYDYKYCLFRSPELHFADRKEACNCHEYFGKKIWRFMLGAKLIFWMSTEQFSVYLEKFSNDGLGDFNKCLILSSVFNDATLDKLAVMRKENFLAKTAHWLKAEWAILKSFSWVKGYANAVKFAKEKRLKTRELYKLNYDQMLAALKDCKGLIYLPNGKDTCPRLVIEARLLGKEIMINDFVQHRAEEWFYKKDPEQIDAYLRTRTGFFWDKIKEVENVRK